MSFGIYGEVLVLTRADDAEAATMLRRTMLGVEAIKGERNTLPYLIVRVRSSRAHCGILAPRMRP
jgi:hypothetical protein